MIFFTRIFVVVTGAIAFTFAININDILSLWLTGIGMTSMILLPGYFLAWMRKPPKSQCIFPGMAAGCCCVLLMIAGVLPMDALHVFYGILLNLFLCILAGVLSKSPAAGR